MAKAPQKSVADEAAALTREAVRHTDYAGMVGRISVEVGKESADLRLWAWGQKPVATLAADELGLLIGKLEDARAKLKGKKPRASAPVVEDDDHDDIA